LTQALLAAARSSRRLRVSSRASLVYGAGARGHAPRRLWRGAQAMPDKGPGSKGGKKGKGDKGAKSSKGK
jgi:hypothetical protein